MIINLKLLLVLTTMSPLGVGLSDVFLIASFAARVHSALKNNGGARSQYQQEISSLEALGHGLQGLQELISSSSNDGFREGLGSQSMQVQSLVTAFSKSISKYDKVLGSNASRRSIKGAFLSTKWEFIAAKELDLFWKQLEPKIKAIELLVSRQSM